jgi:hypothetical protein
LAVAELAFFQEVIMPRYYFNVVNRVRLTDPDGTELPNSASAFVHALQVARELMFKRTGMLGHPWSAWTMRVNDRDGKTIHTISFTDLPDGNTMHCRGRRTGR